MENINDNAALNNDVEKYRNLAALSYVLMPLAAVMLILDKDSSYVRHHVNQVICLLLWFIASSVVMIIPVLGWIAGVAGMVAGVVFMIMAIARTCKKEYYEIPWIGKVGFTPGAERGNIIAGA